MSGGILDDYLTKPELAKELRVCERTLGRYENEPDGLPATEIGGKKLYRREAVRQWLARRERKPNPRRSRQ